MVEVESILHLGGLFAYFLFAILNNDSLCCVCGVHAVKRVGFTACLCVSLDRGNRRSRLLFQLYGYAFVVGTKRHGVVAELVNLKING